ncbi:MAG: murein biosynthesis integral membrane protein MurJ [Peptoniphilaceae bacterium]|nr:murein biosynthesis integral membrane protein MurJ [Peptoniphilaceae bacterium]
MQHTSLLLMLITIGTKCFGLAREKALAHFFGTSDVANIFLIAFTLPMVLSNLFAGSISGGFIPVYTEMAHKGGDDEADRFTTTLAFAVAAIALVLSILAIIFAPTLVHLMAPGFHGATFEKTVAMSRVTALSMTVTAVFSIFKAYLQIHEHFIVSMFHSVVMNSILIVAMFLGRAGDLRILALGIFFAFCFQYVIFLPYLKKSGFHLRRGYPLKGEAMKKMWLLILPILISTSVLELNNIVSKALASTIAPTGVAVINYATKIQGFVTGIVVTSIVTVTYPRMAKLVEDESSEELSRVMRESLSLMAAFVLPATVGVVCFHKEIVRLLFLSGAFSAEDVRATGEVLLFYALGLFAIGIREIGVRIFYSRKDAAVPLINAAYMVAVNVALSFILGKLVGLRGLAMGTSASLWVGAVGMLIHLKRTARGLKLARGGKNLGKIALASALMGIIAKAAEKILMGFLSPNVALLGAIAAAGVSYLLLAFVMKFDEIEQIKKLLYAKRNKV